MATATIPPAAPAPRRAYWSWRGSRPRGGEAAGGCAARLHRRATPTAGARRLCDQSGDAAGARRAHGAAPNRYRYRGRACRRTRWSPAVDIAGAGVHQLPATADLARGPDGGHHRGPVPGSATPTRGRGSVFKSSM